MKYRIEFGLVGAEDVKVGKKEFDAESDAEAISLSNEICKKVEIEVNKTISNRYWRYKIHPRALIRVKQAEISAPVTCSFSV